MSTDTHALHPQSPQGGPHGASYGHHSDAGQLHPPPPHQQPQSSAAYHASNMASFGSDPYGHYANPQGQVYVQHPQHHAMQHHASQSWHDKSQLGQQQGFIDFPQPSMGGPMQPYNRHPMHAHQLSVSHPGSMPAPSQTPPQMAAAAHAASLAAGQAASAAAGGFAYPREPAGQVFDPTGQQCPPGGRPRVSTTIWEDEGTLCFQVEALQVTVARREDDNMINGTKLLNVAQMSRGKRDGILKNEPDRKVIKVGSMHLKGVWIPFDRALALANRYSITDTLYPLFVQDIKKFLLHPANYARTAAVFAAAAQRQGTQPGSASTSVDGDETRPASAALNRALSMPMPLERAIATLTPPSSASTNGDYWNASPNTQVPLSETQARSHSLPGTPAQTPPAPQYMPSHMQQPYIGSSLANGDGNMPRHGHSGGGPLPQHLGAAYLGQRYGQQPDMQRMYSAQHSRNPSMMSYENEDVSVESSSVALTAEQASVNGGLPPPPPHQQHIGHAHGGASRGGHHARQRSQQIRGALPSPGEHHQAVFDQGQGTELRLPGLASSNAAGHSFSKQNGPYTPGGSRSHARTQSRGSTGKVFNTPNLTTQMNRWGGRTPNGSPTKGTASHSRQPSNDGSTMAQGGPGLSSAAANWVQQQQQMAFSTPQQASRAGELLSQHQNGGLPQIFEETPSCRMAYQLHGTRGDGSDAQNAEGQEMREEDAQQVHARHHRAGGQSAPRFIDYGQPIGEHGGHRQLPMQSPIVPGSAPNMNYGLGIARIGSPRLGNGMESPLSGKTKRDRVVSDTREDDFRFHQPLDSAPTMQQNQQHAGPPRYGYTPLSHDRQDEDYAQPPHEERVLQSPLNGSTPGSGSKASADYGHSTSQQDHQQHQSHHAHAQQQQQQHAMAQQYHAHQQMGDYRESPRGSPTPPPIITHHDERPSAQRQRSFRG